MKRLLILAALLLLYPGCGFQAALAKTHAGVKAMSQEVEPPLAAECVKRARACHRAKDTACQPLAECRKTKAVYVSATKAIHSALAEMAAIHRLLVRQGVIK